MKAVCKAFLTAVAILTMAIVFALSASAENGITERINNLRSKFPEGAFWNHQRQVNGDDGDTLLNNWNNSYGDSVTWTPCYTHNGTAPIGQYDCNAFDGAIQCYGFANKVFYDIFGQHCSDVGRRTDTANISIGDHIRLYTWGDTGHSAIVIARNGDSLTIVEGNYNRNCMIHWDRTVSRGDVVGFYHATNWQQIYDDYGAIIDVNGLLDGTQSGSLGSYGTCDVYVNGTRVADDVADYCAKHKVGSTYQITDIKAKSGYEYKSSSGSALSGTLTSSGVNVRLSFLSYGTLDTNGLLDSATASSVSGYGTFDVYINDNLVSSGVADFNGKYPQGTTYEIKNVTALEGMYYNGVVKGSLKGTIGKGTTIITLSFSTIVQPGTDWREASEIPGYIDASMCDIEVNNHYTQTAQTSPGAGWTQVAGSGVTTYVNDGGVYDSDFALETSSTRVQVGSYYYHYCGASVGNRVNFAQTSQYTDYHVAGDVNSFNVTGEWTDDDDARYHSYKLVWNSGQWAGGEATCSAGRSAIWYRRYQYQNKKAVTNYTWTKDSGWTTTADSSANSVTYRFRLKQYTITFDANGGESAPDSVPKYATVDLVLPEALPERRGYQFSGWNTQADGQGTAYPAGGTYSADGNATLYAQWQPMTRLVLPASLKVIEEEAFAGTDALIVVVPDGCGSIGTRAFADSDALVQIFIPASVGNISFDAFEGCGNLTICAPENSTAIRLAKALQIPYEITE